MTPSEIATLFHQQFGHVKIDTGQKILILCLDEYLRERHNLEDYIKGLL